MNLPELPLGVAAMDDDHRALAQLFAATPNLADGELPGHLDRLLDALRAHFEREEAAMAAAQIPILHCHRGQHAALLDEAARLRQAFAGAEAPMRRHIIGFRLSHLVSDHVASADAISARLFADRLETPSGEAVSPCCG